MAGLALTGIMKFFDHNNKYSDALLDPLAKGITPRKDKERSGRSRNSSHDHPAEHMRSREARRRSTGARDYDYPPPPPRRDYHDRDRRRHRSRSHDRSAPRRYDGLRRPATFDDRYYDHRSPPREWHRPREEMDRRAGYDYEPRRQKETRYKNDYYPPPPPPRAGPPRDAYRHAGPPPDDRRRTSIYDPR